MRNLLLASAAVIATLGTISGTAQADYWATLNVNEGYINGDLNLHSFSATYESAITAANIGALTVNDNEENVKVRVKGPVVDIDIDQDAKNRNSQGAYVHTAEMSNDTGDQNAHAHADDPIAGIALVALAGAAAGNVGIVGEQENEVKTYDNDHNRQYAGNVAIVYVDDPFGGLLDCGCSNDEFYTANINYGNVSGDIHAGGFSLKNSTMSTANVGAATLNSSLNNMNVRVSNGANGHL